jgi:hypothetical protein
MTATQNGTGFLSFNSRPPRLFITAEDAEFDEIAMQHWRDEGERARFKTFPFFADLGLVITNEPYL